MVSSTGGLHLVVDDGHVVDASLGSSSLPWSRSPWAWWCLRERLHSLQSLAVAVAAVAVALRPVSMGPAVDRAGRVSRRHLRAGQELAGVDAFASLTVKMLLLTPIALAYIGWLWTHDQLAFGSYGWGHALLMVGAGPVTALRCCSSGSLPTACRCRSSAAAVRRPLPAAHHRRLAVRRADVAAALACIRRRLDRAGRVHRGAPRTLAPANRNWSRTCRASGSPQRRRA